MTAGSERASAEREVVVPFPVPIEAIKPATEYFASGIATSLQLLRAYGHYDAYLQQLPEKHREPILSLIVGEWVPMELAIEHYLACDRLRLPREEMLKIGEEASIRLYSPTFVFAAKVASSAGVTPWTVIHKLPLTITKSLRGGGGVSAVKLGPKEVRIEFEGHPLAASSYVRTALTGTLRHPVSLFCRKAVARELVAPDRPNAMAYLLSWV